MCICMCTCGNRMITPQQDRIIAVGCKPRILKPPKTPLVNNPDDADNPDESGNAPVRVGRGIIHLLDSAITKEKNMARPRSTEQPENNPKNKSKFCNKMRLLYSLS